MADLEIAQKSEARGDDYWDWSVWIEGTTRDIGQIRKVVWKLHPTFPQPVVTRTDPKTKFLLKTAGWGVFMIGADVHLKNGKRIELTHMLEFAPASKARTTKKAPQKKTPHVMLSFAATDVTAAEELRTLLKKKGAKVIEASSGRRGLPAAAMVREAVQQSDALIALHDEANPSRWVQAEIEEAKEHGRPVLTINPSADPASVPDVMKDVSALVKKLSRT